MTTITALPGSYYQLSNLQNSGSGGSGNASTGGASSIQPLVDALNAANSGSSQSASNDAYSLNLSSAAQLILNNSANTGANNSGNAFVLTQAQKTAISNIIAKYKDAPFTQDTFNQIQNDLEAAGLGADQLSAKDQVNSLNLTSALLNDLNGNYAPLTSMQTALSNEQAKASSYMQGVIKEWRSISTTASSGGQGLM